MGKGDKKSKRGKITIGSYGVRRSRKKRPSLPVPVITAKPEEKKKVPAKKPAKAPVEFPVAEKEVAPVEAVVKTPKKKAAPKTTAKKEPKAE